jgi:hypothetical protein
MMQNVFSTPLHREGAFVTHFTHHGTEDGGSFEPPSFNSSAKLDQLIK